MQLKRFKVTNYRNIVDSDWIDLNQVTAFVGQNEAGKSNLFEALNCINPFIAADIYDIHEDWPVDRWGDRNPSVIVCEAEFELTPTEIADLYSVAGVPEQPSAHPPWGH